MDSMIDTSDGLPDSLFEEVTRKMESSDATENIDFSNYLIFGDVEEIKRVIRTNGIVNISLRDVIETLSLTHSNYVTTGTGRGTHRTLIALKQATDRLPISSDDIDKMIVNISYGTNSPVGIRDIKVMIDWIKEYNRTINLIWGVACDNGLPENEIKITLLAVNKNRIS